MKYVILICLAMLLVLPGCRNADTAQPPTGSKSVNDVLKEGMDKSASAETGQKDGAKTAKKSLKPYDPSAKDISADDIDIDLTSMTTNMIYARVASMMSDPEKYVNKTVRMTGTLTTVTFDNKFTCFCLIKDATACCQQGVSFVLADDFPMVAFPQEGSPITVIGTFSKLPDTDSYAVTDAKVYAL